MNNKKLFTADIKFAINYFIASVAPTIKQLLLTQHLNSTKILTEFGHTKIDVINYVPLNIAAVNPDATMRTGVSTDVLRKLTRKAGKSAPSTSTTVAPQEKI